MALALVEEYGTYAGERLVRRDLGLFWLEPSEVSELCRKLTRTMLSVRLVRKDEEQDFGHLPVDSDMDGLLEAVTTEDRSITWPGYPDPTGRIAYLKEDSRWPKRR